MKKLMPQWTPSAAVCLLALLLAGCGSLLTSKQPPRQVYMLQPLAAGGGAATGVETVQLRLEVIPGLDTDRVLALDPDARLVPYANARWPDHLPEVLRSVLRRSLESAGRIDSDGVAAENEWSLDLELQAFYGLLDAAGGTRSVRVALAGRAECNGNARNLRLEDSATVPQERLSAVVAAHQAALDGVTRQLLQSIDEGCSGQ